MDKIPKTLYHITENVKLASILEKGLIPGTGENDWRNDKDYVYLTDEDNINIWISWLDHLNDPVIVEVNTEDITTIEEGRSFTDMFYETDDIYSEYRTTEPIPATAIKQASIDRELSDKLYSVLTYKLKKISELEMITDYDDPRYPEIETEIERLSRGLDRLADMNIIDRELANSAINKHNPGYLKYKDMPDTNDEDYEDFTAKVDNISTSNALIVN